MDDTTIQYLKQKIEKAEKLKKQIQGLQMVIRDLDLITREVDRNGTHVPLSRTLIIRSHVNGAGEPYNVHDKASMNRDELTMLIIPTLFTELEALLDQKFKELEEL